ncbi:hypothetical protein ABPG72_020488, partial [Tetrahymena utriculariae]
GNKIYNEGAGFIAEFLEKNQNIAYQTINLQENYIGYEGAQRIIEVLKQCQIFIELNIYLFENNFDYYSVESILDDLNESQQNSNQLTFDKSEYAIKFRDQNHINKQEISQDVTHLFNLNLSQNPLNTENKQINQLKIQMNWTKYIWKQPRILQNIQKQTSNFIKQILLQEISLAQININIKAVKKQICTSIIKRLV